MHGIIDERGGVLRVHERGGSLGVGMRPNAVYRGWPACVGEPMAFALAASFRASLTAALEPSLRRYD